MDFDKFCGFYYLTNGHVYSVTNCQYENLGRDVKAVGDFRNEIYTGDKNIKISIEVDIKNNNIIWYENDKIIQKLKNDDTDTTEYDIFDLNKQDWYFNIGLDYTYDKQGDERSGGWGNGDDDSYIVEASFSMQF
jgi:hypothetical protein